MARLSKRPYTQPSPRHLQVAFVPYVGALLVVFLAIAIFGWRTDGTNAASGSGSPVGQGGRYFWCGQVNQPSCPANDPGWVSIKSEAPVDLMDAVSSHGMFAAVQEHYGHLTLDLPVLVHPYAANTGSDYFMDDHWVIAVRNESGNECGLFDFVYDSVHMRIKFASYGVLQPSDPRYGHAFPRAQIGAAQTQVARERHVSALVGTTPKLVFFAIDHQQSPSSKVHNWTGGGSSPMDPMWLIVGSDGVQYFVGADLHTYLGQELPVESM